ncbi:MAG: exodeoxyribonuclease VII large subunit [Chloroflexota bacterium]
MQSPLFEFQRPTLSVTDINRHIRQVFDLDEILQDVWLEGEISNWSQAASGHIYFTLKDREASIRCVIWRSAVPRLRYKPQGNGEAILAHGRVSVYEVGGVYQLYVDDMQPAGLGELYAQFERLKNQLSGEGLFDVERKKALPPLNNRIGIVTSPIAAALQDVLTVLARRYPLADVILSPAPVQGLDAPPQLCAALNRLLAVSPAVDVILIVRGGGSIEDLWAFNDEALARAIAEAPIPIVTGVGHETDFTIVDFVADHRAPTPSAAAELVTPDFAELKRHILGSQAYLTSQAKTMLTNYRTALQDAVQALTRQSPQTQINQRRQQVDDYGLALKRSMRHVLRLHRERLSSMQDRLQTLSPLATLERGYALVRHDGQIVRRFDDVQPDDLVTITVQDGEIKAIIQK